MKKIFGRKVTKDLQKQISVIDCADNGTCTRKTYNSLLEMPEQERLEYVFNAMLQCDNEITPEQIMMTRENVKNILAAKIAASQR